MISESPNSAALRQVAELKERIESLERIVDTLINQVNAANAHTDKAIEQFKKQLDERDHHQVTKAGIIAYMKAHNMLQE